MEDEKQKLERKITFGTRISNGISNGLLVVGLAGVVYSMGGAALTSFKAQEMTRRYLREEPIPIGSPANEERDVALYLGMSVLFGGLSSYGLLRKVRKEEQDKKSTP